ncbi:hypothetical protein LJR143_002204 [Pseudoxanthomonas sp. LjRoot143]|uniref:hypothetical protein n=1 Tax=Pseudoxanthomonas sp. LjRoot143 TaxID=3342266 RepID=UPI003ECFB423
MARAPGKTFPVPTGWAEAAAAVHHRLQARSTYDVYLSPDGVLWMRQIHRHFNSVLPDAWLVGRYRPAAPLQAIEDDMICRMREITEAALRRGAAA